MSLHAWRRTAGASLLTLMTITALGIPAGAANWCFEDIGCPADHLISRKKLKPLSCENLRHVRNAIYDQNGYCFRSKALAQMYDNSDCSYSSPAAVPLNRYERRNVSRIIEVERANACK